MARRSRERLKAPESVYEREGHLLRLRGALTLGTRAEYAAIGGAREDAWQRRVEFLFERLVTGWEVAGVHVERKQLLARFRMASADERQVVRDVLREHVAEHFPDVEAP